MHDQQKGDPNELQRCPKGKGDGPWIAQDKRAEWRREYVACLRGCRGGEHFDVAPYQRNEERDAKFEGDDVDEKMADVVVTDAVVDPRTVMIVLCDAALTATAMFAAQRLAYHALDAEVFFVELPKREEFFDYFALLVARGKSRNVARVLEHCSGVEIGCGAQTKSEEDVQEGPSCKGRG